MHRALIVLLGLAALLAEAVALALIADLTGTHIGVGGFFAAHAVASLILGFLVLEVLAERYRRPWQPIVALLAAIAFFVPVLGTIGLVTAVLVVTLLPKASVYRPFANLRPPEYPSAAREGPPQMRMLGLRTSLLDTSLPADVRVKSLVALQNMPPRVAIPILRRLLCDSTDDVRLAAYGIIDAREKRISAAIRDELDRLPTVTEPAARENCLRRLAEEHWELVHSDLAPGDLRRVTIESGLRYLEAALQRADRDTGLWLLKGRFLHAAGDPGGAAQALATAIALGLPESRVLPYLAEIYFDQCRFDDVRRCMNLVAATQRTPRMAPLIRYWAPRTDTA